MSRFHTWCSLGITVKVGSTRTGRWSYDVTRVQATIVDQWPVPLHTAAQSNSARCVYRTIRRNAARPLNWIMLPPTLYRPPFTSHYHFNWILSKTDPRARESLYGAQSGVGYALSLARASRWWRGRFWSCFADDTGLVNVVQELVTIVTIPWWWDSSMADEVRKIVRIVGN